MSQRVSVDRRALLLYVALAVSGCHAAPGALVPEGAAPVNREQVSQWVATTIPAGHRLHRFKWLFQDERSSAGGRGSARIAPPDSLRFDVAGPFGTGASSAVVVGNEPIWVQPPDAIKKLVPNYPLMWAMFGVARMPEDDAKLRGVDHEGVTAWQYAGAADTIDYLRTTGRSRRLVAEVHHAGELIGRAETTLDSVGRPVKSRLTVPSVPAKLDLTFLSTAQATFASDIWAPRKP
ncbi:MAG TPA: hypothetical protein VH763_04415 [Gemmatimonadales bacterium]|jgi:hypothetical protein